jgi:hypothetical protein
VLHLLATLATAMPAGPEAPPVEPVLEWAKKDLHRISIGRAGLLVSTVSPGLLVVGFVASSTRKTTGSDSPLLGNVLTGTGVAGLVLGPPLLLYGTTRASSALRHQGLEVRSTNSIIAGSAYGVGLIATVAGLAASNGAATELDAGVSAIVAVTYLTEVTFGALQGVTNHPASRRARWLDVGVVPIPGPAPGLAIVGRL